MIRRPPRSTLDRSSAASDVYKRQAQDDEPHDPGQGRGIAHIEVLKRRPEHIEHVEQGLSLIHISEPTRPY